MDDAPLGRAEIVLTGAPAVAMLEREGVTKYDLTFRPAPARSFAGFRRLNGWRSLLFRLQLIGQAVDRYGGRGYGNVSLRIGPSGAPLRFMISGTQTGGIARLGLEHYCLVRRCDPLRNRVIAEGPVEPSSEALTHAAVYAANDGVRSVLHVHSPEIWHRTRFLRIASTGKEVAYGTPQMAQAVDRLLHEAGRQRCRLFSMLGHEDGVMAFGASPDEAGQILVRCFALALAKT